MMRKKSIWISLPLMLFLLLGNYLARAEYILESNSPSDISKGFSLIPIATSSPIGSNNTDFSISSITTRVSVASDGSEGNGESIYSSFSIDGRYVAFQSKANNLVPSDTNDLTDVFVHDRETGLTERVSVSSSGIEGNGTSWFAHISSDGRYVAFGSSADNLVVDDTNGHIEDVFVHDRETGLTERVSVSSSGIEGNFISNSATISSDGRYVAFLTYASNLVPNDTNDQPDIMVHDRQTGVTERASVASDGTQTSAYSRNPVISANGLYVVFESIADNLVDGDTNSTQDIFVHNRQTGVTERTSVASDGTEGNGYSSRPSISADGRYVAFESSATNLVDGDTNGHYDIFVHDRQTGVTERISVSSTGTQSNDNSGIAYISSDGHYVTFSSRSTNFISGDSNNYENVFLHDRETSQTDLISVASDGTQGNQGSHHSSVSSDGRFVTFSSYASNLVFDDTNGSYDIFVHDRRAETYSISGRVEDTANNPIPGVIVWAGFPSNTTTDSNGNYLIENLAEGTYNVHAEKEGYHFNPISIPVEIPPNSSGHDFIGYTQEECNSSTDTDGDALLDGWELCGYDHDGDGSIDVNLPALGANYLHTDIFVEIDYMEAGPGETSSHQPRTWAINTIVQSFDNAPTSNPDGTTGIHLHVDYGPEAPLTWASDTSWGNYSEGNSLPHQDFIGSCPLTFLWTNFDSIKNANFDAARWPIFHYNIWAHRLCPELPTVSGISKNQLLNTDSGASDFIVGLGGFSTNPGSREQQAGIFMHELGHNLGLSHGGGDRTNYKPNYLSVMNYSFLFHGLLTDNSIRRYDYSRFELPTLNELNLNETTGINLPESITDSYGTVWYCENFELFELTGDATAVDWNCNQDRNETFVSANINRGFQISLSGFNDWENIVYSGGEVGGLGAGEEVPVETEIDELTEEEAALIPYRKIIFLPIVNK